MKTAEKSQNQITNLFKRLRENCKDSEYLYLGWTFIVPLMILWVIFIFMEVYPFGDNSVLVLDLNGQYVSFFEALRRMIHEGGSLLYTWERALGGEFMGIFAYYISSPFSFIVALFPKGNITEALLCIHLLKCGSCGLAMGWYLHKTHPSKRINIIIFSVMYALTSYAIVYAHNTMWIDELIILPFLSYGIEMLIKQRKYKMFTISLAMALISNFYIGYMMCIYTFFYFFYYYFMKGGSDRENNFYMERFHFIRSLARVGFFSAIAVMTASMIILPTAYSLTFGKSTFTTPDYSFAQRFDFLDIFVKFFPGSYDTVRPEGLPWIYCGTLAIVMLPVYFMMSGIKVREKIFNAVLMIFFIISFNSTTIDLVWHGFQKPNWLNNRYSFMFCFIFILCAYQAFIRLREIDFKWIIGVCGVYTVALMVIQKQGYEFVHDLKLIWVSLACIGLTLIGLYFAGKRGTLVLAVIVCIELFGAGLLNVTSLDADVVYTTRTNYVTNMKRVSPIIDKIKASDDSFYRMEKALYRKTNDPMAYGFNGLSNSTSTLNESVVTLLNRLGLSAKSHWSKYIGGNPVSDSLLGLKYIVYPDEKHHELFYESYIDDEDNTLYAYKNPYAMSIAFGANKAITEVDIEDPDNPFLMMNHLVTTMLGSEENMQLFRYIKPDDIVYDNCDMSYVTEHKKYSPDVSNRDARIVMTFDAPTDDEIFLFIPTKYPRELKIHLNGEDHGTILGNDTDCIISLGLFEPGDEVIVALTLEDEMVYIANGATYIYYLDSGLFRETMPLLLESNMTVTEYSDTYLEGTVTIADDESVLFTTIPYDEGWVVKVDGEEMPLIKTLNSLLAVDITAGLHTVTFKYQQKWFKIGAILCVSGLMLFAIVIVAEQMFMRRTRKINRMLIDNQTNV